MSEGDRGTKEIGESLAGTGCSHSGADLMRADLHTHGGAGGGGEHRQRD